MFFGCAPISSCAFLLFIPILCTAQVPNDNLVYSKLPEASITYEKRSPPLRCYVCNSKYDSRCGDPFNPYSIGIINCSDRKPPEQLLDPLHFYQQIEPVVCRKSVQRVEGDVRVIRGCGYIRDEHDNKTCFRRTGTSAIDVVHCACFDSLCNTGHPSQRPISILTMAIAIVLAITSFTCGLSF